MDKNRIAGKGKQIKGAIKKTIGKLSGDAKLQAEGKANQVEAKIHGMVGRPRIA